MSNPTTAPVHASHFVRVRYAGPTESKDPRYVVSWEGWPTDGPRFVRRTMEWDGNRERMARAAAAMFCEWLGSMPGDDAPRSYAATRITYASASPDEWAVLIETKDSRDAA